MKNILLLEDDLQLNDTIKQFLEYKNYKIYPAYDAYEAKDILYEQKIDLMLLDIKVPYQNGFDFLTEVRAEKNSTPAIFITSLNSVDDVTRGFDIGCDDYIRKPFALKELLVRIEVIFKRQVINLQKSIDLNNGYSFDFEKRLLLYNNKTLNIRTKEMKLLILLLENPNKLLSYNDIFNELWEYDEIPSHGSLRAYISTIRNILGKDKIETLKYVGYRYVKQ
ncbi:MAG TPA: response regulator transcription factor [Campylobacterales bacterium]|nr:response regulator transcription factor [Campylobacterales bacterium]HHD80321.1 response regulator transcription factor [Campylobacterales bacterium]